MHSRRIRAPASCAKFPPSLAVAGPVGPTWASDAPPFPSTTAVAAAASTPATTALAAVRARSTTSKRTFCPTKARRFCSQATHSGLRRGPGDGPKPQCGPLRWVSCLCARKTSSAWASSARLSISSCCRCCSTRNQVTSHLKTCRSTRRRSWRRRQAVRSHHILKKQWRLCSAAAAGTEGRTSREKMHCARGPDTGKRRCSRSDSGSRGGTHGNGLGLTGLS